MKHELPVPSGLKVSPCCRREIKPQQGRARGRRMKNTNLREKLECRSLVHNERGARGATGVNECTGERRVFAEVSQWKKCERDACAARTRPTWQGGLAHQGRYACGRQMQGLLFWLAWSLEEKNNVRFVCISVLSRLPARPLHLWLDVRGDKRRF